MKNDDIINFFKKHQQDAIAAAKSAATATVSSSAGASASKSMSFRDITALKEYHSKKLTTTEIRLDDEGVSCMAATLELCNRRETGAIWSDATYIDTQVKNAGGLWVDGNQIDLLKDFHGLPEKEMNSMSTDRWQDKDAQMRSQDGSSVEFQTICLGVLLTESCTIETKQAIMAIPNSHDGQVVWHYICRSVYPTKHILFNSIKTVIRTTANDGFTNDADAPSFINKLRQLLLFSGNDPEIERDTDGMQLLLQSFKRHSNTAIQQKSDEIIMEFATDPSSSSDITGVLDTMHELVTKSRNVAALTNASCFSKPNANVVAKDNNPGNVVAMYATNNNSFDDRINSIVKALKLLCGRVTCLENEGITSRAAAKKRFDIIFREVFPNQPQRQHQQPQLQQSQQGLAGDPNKRTTDSVVDTLDNKRPKVDFNTNKSTSSGATTDHPQGIIRGWGHGGGGGRNGYNRRRNRWGNRPGTGLPQSSQNTMKKVHAFLGAASTSSPGILDTRKHVYTCV